MKPPRFIRADVPAPLGVFMTAQAFAGSRPQSFRCSSLL